MNHISKRKYFLPVGKKSMRCKSTEKYLRVGWGGEEESGGAEKEVSKESLQSSNLLSKFY